MLRGTYPTNNREQMEAGFIKKAYILLVLFALLVLTSPSAARQEERAEPKRPVPLEDIDDILAWKSIRSPVLSNDGKWFAYRVAPTEGVSHLDHPQHLEDVTRKILEKKEVKKKEEKKVEKK